MATGGRAATGNGVVRSGADGPPYEQPPHSRSVFTCTIEKVDCQYSWTPIPTSEQTRISGHRGLQWSSRDSDWLRTRICAARETQHLQPRRMIGHEVTEQMLYGRRTSYRPAENETGGRQRAAAPGSCRGTFLRPSLPLPLQLHRRSKLVGASAGNVPTQRNRPPPRTVHRCGRPDGAHRPRPPGCRAPSSVYPPSAFPSAQPPTPHDRADGFLFGSAHHCRRICGRTAGNGMGLGVRLCRDVPGEQRVSRQNHLDKTTDWSTPCRSTLLLCPQNVCLLRSALAPVPKPGEGSTPYRRHATSERLSAPLDTCCSGSGWATAEAKRGHPAAATATLLASELHLRTVRQLRVASCLPKEGATTTYVRTSPARCRTGDSLFPTPSVGCLRVLTLFHVPQEDIFLPRDRTLLEKSTRIFASH